MKLYIAFIIKKAARVCWNSCKYTHNTKVAPHVIVCYTHFSNRFFKAHKREQHELPFATMESQLAFHLLQKVGKRKHCSRRSKSWLAGESLPHKKSFSKLQYIKMCMSRGKLKIIYFMEILIYTRLENKKKKGAETGSEKGNLIPMRSKTRV